MLYVSEEVPHNLNQNKTTKTQTIKHNGGGIIPLSRGHILYAVLLITVNVVKLRLAQNCSKFSHIETIFSFSDIIAIVYSYRDI